MEEVVLQIERPRRELVEEFKKISTPTICESMNGHGFMSSQIKPLFCEAKMAGPAVTCFCHVGDNLMLHKALQLASSGDVIVANHGGYMEAAPWGQLMSLAARKKGVEGVVIDGAVRDSPILIRIGFPVFARGTAMSGTMKKSPGLVNKPIDCGGVCISPGDIVVGDYDGVVVIPRAISEEVLRRARERDAREEEVIKCIEKGEISDFMHDYAETYSGLVKTKKLSERMR